MDLTAGKFHGNKGVCSLHFSTSFKICKWIFSLYRLSHVPLPTFKKRKDKGFKISESGLTECFSLRFCEPRDCGWSGLIK